MDILYSFYLLWTVLTFRGNPFSHYHLRWSRHSHSKLRILIHFDRHVFIVAPIGVFLCFLQSLLFPSHSLFSSWQSTGFGNPRKSLIDQKIRPEGNGPHQLPTIRKNVFKPVSIEFVHQHLPVNSGRLVTKST